MTGGPSRREQSEQFSLQELMKIEAQRVREEASERLARERAEGAAPRAIARNPQRPPSVAAESSPATPNTRITTTPLPDHFGN